MTSMELVGLVALLVLALALPAIGESIRRRSEDRPDPQLDRETLSRLDSDSPDTDRDT